VAGDDLNSSLIVPLIKRAEPEGAGGSSPLPWPEGTPIAEELAGELYIFYGFDLPGGFRLVSGRDCARMQLISLRAGLSFCTRMVDLRRA
jgi:hypothetical protein